MAVPKAPHFKDIKAFYILIERLRNVRKIFFSIVESTPKIFNVIIIVFLHVLFFGTLGIYYSVVSMSIVAANLRWKSKLRLLQLKATQKVLLHLQWCLLGLFQYY